jgi:sugar/nucleoside kinase (ribokinase family)
METGIRLWVVGTVGIDTITTRKGRFENQLGGSVTYAGAAASFFTRVGSVGVVGSDFPDAFMERYLKLGMDVAGIQFEQGPTFHWEGVYEADMVNRRTIRTDLGVLETFAPQLPGSYRDAPFVLLGNINPDLQLRLLDQASGARFVAVDSMDLWINCARSTLVKVIGRSHLVTLNDSEARQLTGQFSLRQCAAALFDMGVEYVLIKKGEHGALLFSREGLAIIPAYPVQEVCDPTGAGDTYAGAFMGYLAEHGTVDLPNLRQALLHASAVAAFGVEDMSTTRLEALTRAEIDTRARELREMTAL